MQIVTTRDFRTNQTRYLNLAKQGHDVVLVSRTGSFRLVPVSDDDRIMRDNNLSPEQFSDIRNGLNQLAQGKTHLIQDIQNPWASIL